MKRLLTLIVLAAPAPAAADPWLEGAHATGTWDGRRDTLEDHGVSLDVVYAAEAYANTIGARGADGLGHLDVALTLDTGKLGLWDGGTFYALGQNSVGTGIDADVGSATTVSNLEAPPYTQLTELFFQQSLAGDRVMIRVGKQDANRDFGTPRFGGNFIDNNFGMYPTSPLPSYPTTGLGAIATVAPTADAVLKAGVYEGNPQIGGFHLTDAFTDHGGYIVVGGAAYTHHYGPSGRDGGTTSVGVWRQELGAAQMQPFASDDGVFIQNDERIYRHPDNESDPAGLTFITRVSWARAARTPISRYLGATLAWHGLGFRHDDTVGIAAGGFRNEQPVGGSPGPRWESFVEAFYKWRLTPFFSLQPDLMFYRHPGGDGRDALIVGGRVKVKL